MRGHDEQTTHMFSYLSPEQRVPADHPLRAVRALTDEALQTMSRRFASLYATTGRPSIPPEQLLRALLLQVLYTVRSERLLMEELNYNLLFRWFVGLNMDDPVWHPTTFTKNRIDTRGIRLGDQSFVADSGGYRALITWADTHGRIKAFGIEGTGSYGAGLARAVRRAGHRVVEVNRGDRHTRRAVGKSDTVDAESAARSVLAGQATATPKTGDGVVEMIRQLKIARDTAGKARTAAMVTLKQIVVNAPPHLREALHALTDHRLLTRCAALRPGPLDTPTAAAKHTLRALARRWLALAEEIATHDQHLTRLTTEAAPTLLEGFGVGALTAAQMLIIFGDNPDRIRSEAAFAKLCGACPIPASSGMTTGRHRLYRGGHRQANAALHRTVVVRMRLHQPTVDDVARRTAGGRTRREIIRCLKRFLAREIYQRVMADFRMRRHVTQAA